jgi:biotin-(acetyl-CoA carboxylase) ligase
VCGLLVEGRGKWLALGIGINVKHRPEDFPEHLRDTACSVEQAAGRPCRRADVLRAVLNALDERVMVLRSGGVAQVRCEWVEACGAIGRRVRAGAVEGIVEDLDETGALVLSTGEGRRTVMFGEVVEMDEGPAVHEDPGGSEG